MSAPEYKWPATALSHLPRTFEGAKRSRRRPGMSTVLNHMARARSIFAELLVLSNRSIALYHASVARNLRRTEEAHDLNYNIGFH